MEGLSKVSMFALFILALLPFVSSASLSCTLTTPAACNGPSDLIVMYLENETDGTSNAHAENVSSASYDNVVCCTPTGDTLSLSCSDQIFGHLSNVTNAHFEQNNESTYDVDQCMSASTEHIVCEYSTSGCGAYDTCLFSYASSYSTNSTNAHVASCGEYVSEVCCTLNDRPTLTMPLLNATSANNLSRDNLTIWPLGLSDDENDAVTNMTDWRRDNESIAFLQVPFDLETANSAATLTPDYTSNTFDGTLVGSPTWTTDCILGGCYAFNGAGQYIDFGDFSGHSLSNMTYDISFSFWYTLSGTSASNQYIFSSGGQTTTNGLSCWVDNSEQLACQINDGTGFYVVESPVYPLHTWQHAVVQYQDDLLELYINGSLVDSDDTLNPGAYGDLHSDFFIGRPNNALNHYFNGSIDEFYAFNRTLSEDFISLLYTSAVNGEKILELPASETSAGENWSVAVTPNDRYQDGITVYSNSLFISAGEVLIEHQPSFVNWTTAHAFNVTAGASYASGASGITSTSIAVDNGACSELATNLDGNFYNVTYNCSGTPFTTASINITFCDAALNCNTTETRSNAYPNQAPVLGNLLLPVDGNDTLIDRLVFFDWENASDPENDTFNYTINVTNAVCQDQFATDFNYSNYTFNTPFNTSFECLNNEYFWQVRACDDWNCSAYTTTFNFSIQDYLNINVVQNDILFDNLSFLESNDTTDDNPLPFLFENGGNIKANLININSTGIWSSVLLNTSFYQSAVDNSSEANSFDWENSLTTWRNISDNHRDTILISALDYNDSQDSAEIEINLTVPTGEPSGQKSDTLTFVWESS